MKKLLNGGEGSLTPEEERLYHKHCCNVHDEIMAEKLAIS